MTPLESALSVLPTDGDEQIMLIAAKCRGLMVGYDARWKSAGWDTVAVEETFHLPVINPETGAKSRTFTQAGKCDGIVARDGRMYLLEHKTTSDDIADPNGTYWRRLAIDSQVSAYVLANWQNGRKLDGTLYDVIRKPGIRPKNLSKADRAQIISGRTYCGFQLTAEIENAMALGQERECNELYAMRLARECIDEPDKYFGRRPIPRMDSDITEYAGELWAVGQSIIDARAKNAHYRNSASCVQYNSPCEFLGICSGYDSPDSDKWIKAETVHNELPIAMEDGGRSVLTNSRIKVFQSCRRKHQLKFEIGIRRRDEEEREALLMGTLFHAALEKWWVCFRKGNEDGNGTSIAGDTGSPAITGASQAELAF